MYDLHFDIFILNFNIDLCLYSRYTWLIPLKDFVFNIQWALNLIIVDYVYYFLFSTVLFFDKYLILFNDVKMYIDNFFLILLLSLVASMLHYLIVSVLDVRFVKVDNNYLDSIVVVYLLKPVLYARIQPNDLIEDYCAVRELF